MLLKITTTHRPATDLGYLLHKHPDKWQTFDLSFGQAHIFYPVAAPDKCTVALLLEVDVIGLKKRRRTGRQAISLEHYVNDRAYVASSFMSVAIGKVFGTALAGNCKHRPQLVDTPIMLTTQIACVPSKGGSDLIKGLFEPLGYQIEVERYPLDDAFPQWGDSYYYSVELTQEIKLQELLRHLYILIPVLDKEKHYYIGEAEVEKLLSKAGSWLPEHPLKDLITQRYLSNRSEYVKEALSQLSEEEPEDQDHSGDQEEGLERKISLHQQRLQMVAEKIKALSARSVLDLGCGEGKLLKLLLVESTVDKIVGLDVSHRALQRATKRLRLKNLPPKHKERIQLLHGALTYKDKRLEGFDVAACVEVIEHLDEGRLNAFEKVVFQYAKPNAVIITTPNREYNVLFETLPPGQFRHKDHRFEWTRKEFRRWGNEIAKRFDYQVAYFPIGEQREPYGSPSQMAVFTSNHQSSSPLGSAKIDQHADAPKYPTGN